MLLLCLPGRYLPGRHKSNINTHVWVVIVFYSTPFQHAKMKLLHLSVFYSVVNLVESEELDAIPPYFMVIIKVSVLYKIKYLYCMSSAGASYVEVKTIATKFKTFWG